MIPARSGACPSRWTARLTGGELLAALIGDGLASAFSPLFVAPVPRAPVLPSKAELLEAGPPDHGLTTWPWVDMGAICLRLTGRARARRAWLRRPDLRAAERRRFAGACLRV